MLLNLEILNVSFIWSLRSHKHVVVNTFDYGLHWILIHLIMYSIYGYYNLIIWLYIEYIIIIWLNIFLQVGKNLTSFATLFKEGLVQQQAICKVCMILQGSNQIHNCVYIFLNCFFFSVDLHSEPYLDAASNNWRPFQSHLIQLILSTKSISRFVWRNQH